MKIGFGLVTCQKYPGDPRDSATLYAEALEIARFVESEGLDSIWMSEHHFWDDEYIPSLLVLGAAMAAVTGKIEIGTAVLLAPFYDPLRLAEDAATVDLISNGRLRLGLGAGWLDEEFVRLRIPFETLGRRLSETVKILRHAWGPGPFTFEGKIFKYGPTNVTPKPPGKLPIYIGAFAPDALKRAGRIGDGFLMSSSRGADLQKTLGFVRDGLEKSGRDPKEFQVAMHYPVWLAESREQGLREVLPYLDYVRWKYGDMRQEFVKPKGASLSGPPPMTEAHKKELESAILVGTPQDIADEVSKFREEAGDDLHFIARSYMPGMSLERTKEVIAGLAEVKRLLN